MNIGLFMGVGAQGMQLGATASASASASAAGRAETAVFGTVFQNSMTANEPPKEQNSLPKQLLPLLEDIAGAETMEELAAVLQKLQKQGEGEPSIQRFVKDFAFRGIPSANVQPDVKKAVEIQENTPVKEADAKLVNEIEQLLEAVQQIFAEVKQQPVQRIETVQLEEWELQAAKPAENIGAYQGAERFLAAESAVSSLLLNSVLPGQAQAAPPMILQQLKEVQEIIASQLETADEELVQHSGPQLKQLGSLLNELQKQTEQLDQQTMAELPADMPAANSRPQAAEQPENTLHLQEFSKLEKFPSLQQLVALISENPAKLVEAIQTFAHAAQPAENSFEGAELETMDIWAVLEQLEHMPPEQIQAAVQQLPEKLLAETAVLLKAVELAAPNMDLFRKQEQLVQTIQPVLDRIAGKTEDKPVQPEIKQTNQLPGAFQQVFRFAAQPKPETQQQPEQQQRIDSPVPVLPQTESRSFASVQLEKPAESRSEALLREFQAVLNRANFGQVNGTNRIAIKLYPEHLGQLRIELLEVNGIMTARILASTSAARELLDSQMHQLRQAFTQQNLQVERIDLSQSVQEPSKNEREQAFSRQNDQQKEQQEQNNEQEEQQLSFEEYMIELEG